MKCSVVTIFILTYYSYFWFYLIFVTQRIDSKLVCVKKTRRSIAWCPLLPLKTANNATVLKGNWFKCQVYKKVTKSRLWASWNSKYHHVQWWHKGSETPVEKHRVHYAAIRRWLANSIVSWASFLFFFSFDRKPQGKKPQLVPNCWKLLVQTPELM